jgi:2-polyprenyl-3-methyl-5-hydroxy-6-metoxy-1,4-benzoquinol methylase
MKNLHTFDKKIYKNYITTHFGDFNVDITKAFRSRYYLWKSYIRDMLPFGKDSKILEVGCGMGHNLYALQKLGYRHVIGFDISKECVVFCNKRKLYAVWKSDLTQLCVLPDYHGVFDLIVIYDLLEHLTPMEAASMLTTARQLLSKNGKFLISVPNGEFPFNLHMRYIDLSHKFLYTSASLTQLCNLVGLKAVRFTSTVSFSLEDDRFIFRWFKRLIMYPLSCISLLLLRIYLATLGISLRYPKPQLFCLAEETS